MKWPYSPDDRDAVLTLRISPQECRSLAANAYIRAELAFAEGDTVLQAEMLDRAYYWQQAEMSVIS